MDNKEKNFHVCSKIWIEDYSGNVVFGLGRLRIVETVGRLGSIQAAAKELKMSYRAVWGKIKATENILNQPLLIRNIGGTSGGGSKLTQFAQTLVEKFEHLHNRIVVESDKEFQEILEPFLK